MSIHTMNSLFNTLFSLSVSSLNNAIIDIIALSMTDFLVCTFSSNICRLAYELMQTRHVDLGDATQLIHSIDMLFHEEDYRRMKFDVIIPDMKVLNRQRTLFEKTRKFLKDKWKADVKRMLDAENSLFKTKTTYYQRCQAGVKLREKLATAQNLLNELSASLMQ
ncbi:unnamed protein product [Schistosoma bovis]|nr:unnamed protein product [Schistosoma bovis]